MKDRDIVVILNLRSQFDRALKKAKGSIDTCSHIVATLSYYLDEPVEDQKYKELYLSLIDLFDDEEEFKAKVEEFLIKEEAYSILQGLELKEKQ